MASPTNRTEKIRARHKATRGKRRKALLRNHGSTISDLPLTVPNANEIAQAKARTAKKAAVKA